MCNKSLLIPLKGKWGFIPGKEHFPEKKTLTNQVFEYNGREFESLRACPFSSKELSLTHRII
jgi:hypothetical protein